MGEKEHGGGAVLCPIHELGLGYHGGKVICGNGKGKHWEKKGRGYSGSECGSFYEVFGRGFFVPLFGLSCSIERGQFV